MTGRKSYEGGCHCGAVRFQAALDLGHVVSCNCSICQKRGHILAFAPASDFTLLKGEESLADYQFGRKVIHHMFCRTCGIGPFGRGVKPDGTPSVAVNVRCLDDVDLGALTISHFDGRSL